MSRETAGELLFRSVARLSAAAVTDPEIEAEFLLAHFLGADRGGLLLRKGEILPDSLVGSILEALERRAGREPLQYITGRQEFYSREFGVDPRVLIPRPETEQLIDLGLALLPSGPALAADIGSGSGCIAVTLAAERPDLEIDAVDNSEGALMVALENAKRHRVEDRIRFHRGDLADLPGGWTGLYDLVVSNPPYVSEQEWSGLAPEVRDHEPRQALVPEGGAAGMYAALAASAFRILQEGGGIVFELGHDNAAAALEGAGSAGFEDCVVYPDFQGIRRMLVARKGTGT